jgi:hypothetical protein
VDSTARISASTRADSAKSIPTCRSELVKASSAKRAVPIGTPLSRGCCRITMRVRVDTSTRLAHKHTEQGRVQRRQTARGVSASGFTPGGHITR